MDEFKKRFEIVRPVSSGFAIGIGIERAHDWSSYPWQITILVGPWCIELRLGRGLDK